MPQWDLLNFLADRGRSYAGFRLMMRAEVTDVIEENGRVAGVRAKTPDGEREIRADLVVGCDGRHSTVRARAGLEVDDIGAPIDVLWMRLSKRPEDPDESLGRFNGGHALVMIDRGSYWQCGYVIAKGGYDALKARGIEGLHADITAVAPFLGDRVGELKSWDDVSLLTVTIDRLKRWHKPGLLCIGDAAHAMSPVGGVGINLAIQDAVATANALASLLLTRATNESDLAAVQRRREFPMKVTQGLQVFIQDRVFRNVGAASSGAQPTRPPAPFRLLQLLPFLRRIPARVIGVGVRPEHVRTTEMPRR
jgi:2-polyprenyl-6-methoxyphenol hydroxylase-like FAD-dependent oxidoreductase